ncbi:DUF4382 domain-containing protein [Salinigranum sp. GCM10025319]|uniref:DUF4382 domain-containing protein n=1 Tax=Salinigranum sp. GCM10025319 TaxID=3252687 RepID=UPI003616AD8D
MHSRITVLVVVCVLVAGCTGSPGGRDLEGTVDVYVGNHGQPVDGFEHLNVTVTAVSFVPADRASGDPNTPANGTTTERFDPRVNRTTVDLTAVQGGAAALVDTVTLPVREEYATVVVRVTSIEATLASGERANVTAPGGTLNASAGFAVDPSSETTLLVDLTAVEAEGTNGTYRLEPVGTETGLNLTTPTTATAGPESGANAPGTAGDQVTPTATPTPEAERSTETETTNATDAGLTNTTASMSA